MPNTFFHFKQFSIHQDRCAMKVGTDAVVLAALVEKENPLTVLDIGMGTGVITLMLAQRFPESKVTGVEINKRDFDQAVENVEASPWSNRISVYNQSFQSFSKHSDFRYDLIVSNPPYFSNHLKSSDLHRNLALHTDGLSFGALIKGVKGLLKPAGHFWVILPPRQMEDLGKVAAFFKLFPNEMLGVKNKPGNKILREIKSFSFYNDPQSQKEISIKNEDDSFSTFYKEILKDFLLDF
jgi:tRNA1Val (adenine37-N6)-methyltransferase